MIRERAKETLAMLMIGDGALGALEPVRHCGLWARGPAFWRRMIEPFVRHPGWARAFGAAETGLGLWLASRQHGPQGRPERLGRRVRRALSRAPA